ncbi:Gp138 family membrane-puncturing spike protein [Achromobacter sp. 413638]|uniref:Gp138 family membrane-puncturing spike protein n=1 Tax=Achromobacter sp. 413638 TaxID=3342385 RepID=UPI00370A16F4
MNRLESLNDPEASLRAGMRGALAETWTAMPALIVDFDPVAMTCSAQPAIRARVTAPSGGQQHVPLPLLLDCPVYFPSGGNCTLTFPVKPGDECLVVFASRCIDAWWQSGGVQDQAEMRMHDLSDGFVFVGVRSQPRVLPSVNTGATELRSDDGSTFLRLDPASQKVKIVAPGGFEVVAPVSEFSDQVLVKGLLSYVAGLVGSGGQGSAARITGALNVIGQIVANGKRVDDTHTHTAQGANAATTPPN